MTGSEMQSYAAGMKRSLVMGLLVTGILGLPIHARAEIEQIDLKALAKKARPAVMLLVVSDASGKEIATATGFLVSSDGKLITNHHVIEGAASAVAKAENGGLFPVEGVLAEDATNDLVVLKVSGKNLPFLTLNTNATVEVGTRIAVIGSPLGLEGTLSEGIVSAVREAEREGRLLQMTAAISPGSSGSPVFTAQGQVVGVASAQMRKGQALNFAVPAETARTLLSAAALTGELRPLGSAAAEVMGNGMADVYSSPEFKAVDVAEGKALESHVARKGSDLASFLEMQKAAQRLVNRFPRNAVAYDRLGDAYGWMNFWDEAIRAYSEAIRLDASDANAWCHIGCCYSFKGQYKEAISSLQQAVKIAPDYEYAWLNLGQTYARSGRTEDARRVLELLRGMKTENAKVAARMLEETLP